MDNVNKERDIIGTKSSIPKKHIAIDDPSNFIKVEKNISEVPTSMTKEMMLGIGSLSERDREEIVLLIIETVISQWQNDIDREVCNGGIESIKCHLMRCKGFDRYPEFIIDHVLKTDVQRAGILDMVIGRPVLISAREKATIII